MTMEERLMENAEHNRVINEEKANCKELAKMIKSCTDDELKYVAAMIKWEILFDELLRRYKHLNSLFEKGRDLFRVKEED